MTTTPEVMARIAGDIPGARYREMPGAPHMPTLEQPSLVEDALDEFLPRAPTGAARTRLTIPTDSQEG